MKKKIDIKHILLIVFVCAGLLFITKSFFMTLGILILLLLIDQGIQQYQQRKEFKNMNKYGDDDQ